MASLQKEYSQKKLSGQVYTPHHIVCKILSDIEYSSAKILGKKILDPACGDGNFLTEIAKRILKYSDAQNLKENLECIYGWDTDRDAVKKCVENLNKIIEHKNIDVKWNVKVENAIKKYKSTEKFDFIVGNPPYIRIQHLDINQRAYIQKNYAFCGAGSTDIYIAFYELCLNLLAENGVCGLITPNTFLFTETAKEMRAYFAEHKNLRQITNYGDIQLFNKAATYSAIVIFGKKQYEKIIYQKAISEIEFKEENFAFNETQNAKGKKLKDLCDIHVGITTLCDKAYIFAIEEIDEKFVYANSGLKGKIKIEKDILKPIVKGSKLKSSDEEIREFILFPYKQENSKHIIIPEKELKEKYPLAYKYLLSVKSNLDKRDNGKANPVAWYAFGRSQGLDTAFGEKIIFSPMNRKPNFIYYGNPECVFYSGYCIKSNGNLKKLLPHLNSKRMEDFISASSRDFRGGWKAYNKKVVGEFSIL